MRTLLMLIVAVVCLASFGAEPATKPAYINPFGFLNDYRIQHYLESAVDLQKLEIAQRADRLKALASDPKHASDVFVLCRVLFEAKPKGVFRSAFLGVPSFIGGGDYAGRTLEPITIFQDAPILIVKFYTLHGRAEEPEEYLDWCLKYCQWRNTKYETFTPDKRKEIVEKFIAANPGVKDDADWLRQQAK
jgi:hypothetical protein